MRHEILKRRQFLDDYREIVLYLAEKNVLAADRFCDAVEAAIEVLCSHPELGAQGGVPESARGAILASAPVSQLPPLLSRRRELDCPAATVAR